MKVLYVAPEYPNLNENAAQVRANQLIAGLTESIDLHVFSYRQDGVSVERVAGDHPLTIVLRQPMSINQLVKSVFSRNPRAFRRYAHTHALESFRRVLGEFQPDIVHFDSIGTLGLLECAREAACQPKIVIHSHDSVSKLYRRLVEKKKGVARLDKYMQWQKIYRLESDEFSKADICLVDSAEDATYLRSLNKGNRVEVLPLGFDEEVYCPEGSLAAIEHPALVFSGSMGSEQSIDAAMLLASDIMPLVWKTRPDIHLYLVGGRPPASVRAFGEDRIHVTGYVDDLAGYLRAADIYVCPLRLGSGMRTRIVEALACGCIMVATGASVQGLPVDCMEQPVWFEATSVENFAEEVLRLLKAANINDLKRMSFKYVARRFSWNAVVNELIEKYKELLVVNQ